jgi:hypothetical protein
LEKLVDLEGASKYGSCDSCRVLSIDDDSLIRIKAIDDDGAYQSVCLCRKCAEKLLNSLEEKYKR